MFNPMDLTGKHVLITGGSSGIGRQCAIQASRLGARVTLIARREDKLQETIQMMERPEDHACYPFDLNQTEEIEGLVKTIVAQRGAVDGFCHAAGIGDARAVKLTKPFFVEKMFRIHTYAFIEFVRCLSTRKHSNDGASFVGVSSVAGAVGNASQGAYGAAKAGMDRFSHPAAMELAPRGIRVNTVAYGMVDTPMYEGFLYTGGDLSSIEELQKLGLIDVESASNAVIFLLSDACKYITGVTLPVYGGY